MDSRVSYEATLLESKSLTVSSSCLPVNGLIKQASANVFVASKIAASMPVTTITGVSLVSGFSLILAI